ncbi:MULTISPECIES: hypothetical protein [Gemmobacter]|jgi:hypothetical protein|uniref:hypothetical protein n=1 Tax=Gemmobacter TaxID=204456 RepID=UPI000A4F12DD|nr:MULTISPECIES: hypothetical protein [Gemmobacter]
MASGIGSGRHKFLPIVAAGAKSLPEASGTVIVCITKIKLTLPQARITLHRTPGARR